MEYFIQQQNDTKFNLKKRGQNSTVFRRYKLLALPFIFTLTGGGILLVQHSRILKNIYVRRILIMNVQTFSALAEPNRLAIVNLLLEDPLPVGEIAKKLNLNQPQASKHLRVLSEAGLLEVQPIANRRIYKLRPEPLQEMDKWLETYRRVWETRMERLDDYLNVLQKKKH